MRLDGSRLNEPKDASPRTARTTYETRLEQEKCYEPFFLASGPSAAWCGLMLFCGSPGGPPVAMPRRRARSIRQPPRRKLLSGRRSAGVRALVYDCTSKPCRADAGQLKTHTPQLVARSQLDFERGLSHNRDPVLQRLPPARWPTERGWTICPTSKGDNGTLVKRNAPTVLQPPASSRAVPHGVCLTWSSRRKVPC